jgi:hypothetical protein
LREPQVLAKAISEALVHSDPRYAIADRVDETKGEYVGLRLAKLVTIDFNSDAVLVPREVADAQLAKHAPKTGSDDTGDPPRTSGRWWRRRMVDDLILVDRAHGTTITLVLNIAAGTVDGFPEDVATVIRDIAVSLRISDFEFEED